MAKFCSECGAKLEVVCPKCGNHNRPGSKFCDECGHSLAQPAASGGALQPAQHIKITAAPPESVSFTEGERRQATIVFSDLSGYTSMNEQLDPEEVETIMSRIKNEAVRIVESHE